MFLKTRKFQEKKVVTRFAPSPTGFLHLGNYRTALFNYIYAKQHNGKMILRVEDTDQARSKKEYEEDIIESLEWLGIQYDEIYRQSDRKNIYTRYIKNLLEKGLAYESDEEKDDIKNTVIRFKNPKTIVAFNDVVRGEISMDTKDLGDFVIARGIDDPVYHLAVVIDDFEMNITHVIRGEDHISNTPRQILIQRAIEATPVSYAHIPLVLAPDKTKLSKRHGALPVREYKDEGYLPEALINFLALLGWSPQQGDRSDQNDIFTLEELCKTFSLARVQKGGAIFNKEKLLWVNKEHIKKMPDRDFSNAVKKFLPEEIFTFPQWSEERYARVVLALRDRIGKFSDIKDLYGGGELAYFFERPELEPARISWREVKDIAVTKTHVDNIINILQKTPVDNFLTPEEIKENLWEYATEHGRGSVLWPMRYALSGQEKSPDPFTLASIFGKEETIERLRAASKKLAL